MTIRSADDRLLDTEQFGGADDAPQQAAQHVPAALVTGADTVADDDRRGARVVGDDAVAHVVLVAALAVSAGRHGGDGVDHRTQQVRLVDVVHALQQTGDALDTHPGVDVLAGQRPEDLVILFEVPSPRSFCMNTRFQISM